MPFTIKNPFLEKNYYIYESTIWISQNTGIALCSGKRSFISKNNIKGDSNFLKTGPFNLLYIQKYISDELNKLVPNIYLAKRCDSYGIAMNENANIVFPEDCSKLFKNFSNDIINNKRTLINGGNKNAYTTQINNIENTMFNNYSYTDTYKSSVKRQNDKKELCQRTFDLINMIDTMSEILKSLDTPRIKNDFKDEYNTIQTQYNKNLDLRNELEKKMQEIYSLEHSRYANSKLHLDSTIYASVLWTLLATTIIFYMFKKM